MISSIYILHSRHTISLHKFNLQGVVRFTQTDSETCIIDGTLDGLNPGEHGLAIHECGDISGGCSTGKSLTEALIFASINQQYDNRLFMEVP